MKVYGVTECLPPHCYWRGPCWMICRRWQWLRRALFALGVWFGLMVRDRDLEKMGHGYRVYRLVNDVGSIQPMSGPLWKR